MAACRAEDTVGRVGGDEFVVLLHGADDELAETIAGRIVATVGTLLDLDGGPRHVSVSVGQSRDGTRDSPSSVQRAKRCRQLDLTHNPLDVPRCETGTDVRCSAQVGQTST